MLPFYKLIRRFKLILQNRHFVISILICKFAKVIATDKTN